MAAALAALSWPGTGGIAAGGPAEGSPGTANPSPAITAADTRTLLDYAERVEVTDLPYEDSARNNVRALQRELATVMPPAKDCSRSLGARRYSVLYHDLAEAHETLGNFRAATPLLRQAIDCAPRDTNLLGAYAANLLVLRRFTEARATLQHGLDIDAEDFGLHSVLLRLEFHEQHWSAVIEQALLLQADDADESHWVYWQLLAEVAAARAGTAPPRLPKRKMADKWPVPLWRAVNGQLDGKFLVQDFDLAEDQHERRQQVCEAMFYLGEMALARGDKGLAGRHFALATRMKIIDYVEHDLALGEISRLRAQASSNAHLPAAAHDVLVAR